jgi:hypothetical protein
MKCPACGNEFKNPVAQAGGRVGGRAKVAKGFAVAGQPTTAARKLAWKTRKARAKRSPNVSAHPPKAPQGPKVAVPRFVRLSHGCS